MQRITPPCSPGVAAKLWVTTLRLSFPHPTKQRIKSGMRPERGPAEFQRPMVRSVFTRRTSRGHPRWGVVYNHTHRRKGKPPRPTINFFRFSFGASDTRARSITTACPRNGALPCTRTSIHSTPEKKPVKPSSSTPAKNPHTPANWIMDSLRYWVARHARRRGFRFDLAAHPGAGVLRRVRPACSSFSIFGCNRIRLVSQVKPEIRRTAWTVR